MKNFYDILKEESFTRHSLNYSHELFKKRIPLPTDFSISVKAAIETNNIHHPSYACHHIFIHEVHAYMVACQNSGKYTVEECVNFMETFYHLLGVSYRSNGYRKSLWKRLK